ncbi:hypothetical protein TNCV_3795451 [Trichonephila clavipes]|nr:hypothetical protein TNCV_3795451 [Trichonephila clavipes]
MVSYPAETTCGTEQLREHRKEVPEVPPVERRDTCQSPVEAYTMDSYMVAAASAVHRYCKFSPQHTTHSLQIWILRLFAAALKHGSKRSMLRWVLINLSQRSMMRLLPL